jgi:hypothetical protein
MYGGSPTSLRRNIVAMRLELCLCEHGPSMGMRHLFTQDSIIFENYTKGWKRHSQDVGMRKYIYIHIHIYTHTYTHITRTHTHTHTHTRAMAGAGANT